MLTRKQHDLLLFISQHLSATGVSPSFEEMKDALDLKSKSGVHRLINALEERGFLRRMPNRARALEVLRLPGNTVARNSASLSGIGDARRGASPSPGARPVPLVGRIAAGLPIEAIEDHEQLAVPEALLGPGEYFALQVVGESMVEAGIIDGDFALIQKTDTAHEGDIVVALIDSHEATLKYFHKDKDMVRLNPANTEFKPQYYPPSRLTIQGRLAGLLRRY